jgi:GTP cyclohydrolase II
MTNNPEKVSALEKHGIRVEEQVPCQAQRSNHSDHYLRTKKERMGHLLDL